MTEIVVYRDGKIYCWEIVDFDGFKEKIDRGWGKISLPEGARVSMMCGNLDFIVDQVNGRVEEQEFVKEVEDEIRKFICFYWLQLSVDRLSS